MLLPSLSASPPIGTAKMVAGAADRARHARHDHDTVDELAVD